MRRALVVTLTLSLALSVPGLARDITDMVGRKVAVPDTIRRVYAGSPPATYLVYAIDPSLLVALSFPVREEERRLLRPEFARLPVAGGVFGQGRSVNLEMLLALRPDLALFWASTDSSTNEQFIERFASMGVPSVALDLDRLEDYPGAILFLGDLLNRNARA
jgi:iron complex transport system substrate-binding protein